MNPRMQDGDGASGGSTRRSFLALSMAASFGPARIRAASLVQSQRTNAELIGPFWGALADGRIRVWFRFINIARDRLTIVLLDESGYLQWGENVTPVVERDCCTTVRG